MFKAPNACGLLLTVGSAVSLHDELVNGLGSVVSRGWAVVSLALHIQALLLLLQNQLPTLCFCAVRWLKLLKG